MTTTIDKVTNITETVLVTPEFSGTDIEKINSLQYWAILIKTVRDLNTYVVDHDNKIKVLEQIIKELEQLKLEITNASAQPTQSDTGMPEMKKLSSDESVVDLSTNQVNNYPQASPFSPHRPLTTEDLQSSTKLTTEDICKLAGVQYTSKPTHVKQSDISFEKKQIDITGLQKIAGITKSDS